MQMAKLQETAEAFTRKIEVERRKIEDLDVNIKELNAAVLDQRKKLGGSNVVRENNLKIQKQIKVLENRCGMPWIMSCSYMYVCLYTRTTPLATSHSRYRSRSRCWRDQGVGEHVWHALDHEFFFALEHMYVCIYTHTTTLAMSHSNTHMYAAICLKYVYARVLCACVWIHCKGVYNVLVWLQTDMLS